MRMILCLCCVGAVLQGCASSNSKPTTVYTPTSADQGDTTLARKENLLGLNFLNLEQYPAAEEHFQKALTADVLYGPAHNNLGTLYFRQAKFYQAATEFQYAGKLMPRQPEPRNNLGLVFEATGKLGDAVAAYDKAVALDPENPEFFGNLARARFRRGDRTDDLKELLAKLVALDTRDEWVDWARRTLRKVGRESTTMP